MAMFEFTLLFLSVCCVGPVVANIIKKNVSTDTDTNSSVTDMQPPPLVEQLDAKLADLRIKHGRFAKKEGDTDIHRVGLAIDFLRRGVESVEQLQDIADKLLAEEVTRCPKTERNNSQMMLPDIPTLTSVPVLCKDGFLTSVAGTVYLAECLEDGTWNFADSCDDVPRDCQELYNSGQTSSGVYKVSPDGVQQFEVYCVQELYGGGWTVIQRREDGSEDFYRTWAEYENGFGSAAGEHWVGNDNIHLLTDGQNQTLRVVMEYDDETRYAQYSDFSISDRDQYYKLNVAGYSGTAGDSLTRHNGRGFTTWDQDHDDATTYNCAEKYSGAWWYESCYDCNLNGIYNSQTSNGIVWKAWIGSKKSMQDVKMMVKTKV